MKKILVVIDYQNDFVDGALGFDGAELLDDKIAKKIESYEEGCVFYTLDTHYSNYLETREGKCLPVVHCIDGSHGHALYGRVAKVLEDKKAIGFKKKSFGLDITDEVAKMLPKQEEVESIELVGLVSNICVVSNAVVFQAHYPEATIIVDASCTDSFDKGLNEKVLDVMEGFQVKVIR